jgi:hypothetical protein
MTNQYDGPRRDAPVTVLQSATPTRLTQAEAEELDRLIEAALETADALGKALATPGMGSSMAAAARASADARALLFRWQVEHGLESK